MKKIISLVFSISLGASPVFAWGGGDCPFSKDNSTQEVKAEQVEESDN